MEMAILLDQFFILRHAFMVGHQISDRIFRSLSAENRETLSRLSGRLEGGRLRDPAFRKDRSERPVTPPEIVIDDETYRLLMNCHHAIARALSDSHDPDHFRTREEWASIGKIIAAAKERKKPKKRPPAGPASRGPRRTQ